MSTDFKRDNKFDANNIRTIDLMKLKLEDVEDLMLAKYEVEFEDTKYCLNCKHIFNINDYRYEDTHRCPYCNSNNYGSCCQDNLDTDTYETHINNVEDIRDDVGDEIYNKICDIIDNYEKYEELDDYYRNKEYDRNIKKEGVIKTMGKQSLEEATIKALYDGLKDNTEVEDVEGLVDDVLVVTDPEITTDEYNEVIERAEEIIEDTPEGDIPLDPTYLGEYLQICPICGGSFVEDHILEPGTACPICYETPESFVMVGKLQAEDDVAEDNGLESEEPAEVDEEEFTPTPIDELGEEPEVEETEEEVIEEPEVEERPRGARVRRNREVASKEIPSGNKLAENVKLTEGLEKPSFEVKNCRLSGQDEGLVAIINFGTEFGNFDISLLYLDGEYKIAAFGGLGFTDDEQKVIDGLNSKYGLQNIIDYAVNVYEAHKSNKIEENRTEDYWDATEIVRDGFMSLMKFNFGTDSKGNNYIITVDANDVKRFRADSDEEAVEIYNKFKEDWQNSDHADLTMNIKTIAPRDESKKVEFKDPEEGFEVDTALADTINGVHIGEITATYNPDTNTVLFFNAETGEDLDTIVYRNQTPEEIEEYMKSDVGLGLGKKTEAEDNKELLLGAEEDDKEFKLIEITAENSEKINELARKSAFTWEGMNIGEDNLQAIVDDLKEKTKIKLPVIFYTWKGSLFNDMFELSGDVAYPDDLNFLSIDLDNWSEMGNLPIFKIQVQARWLDDIIDNNIQEETIEDEE